MRNFAVAQYLGGGRKYQTPAKTAPAATAPRSAAASQRRRNAFRMARALRGGDAWPFGGGGRLPAGTGRAADSARTAAASAGSGLFGSDADIPSPSEDEVNGKATQSVGGRSDGPGRAGLAGRGLLAGTWACRAGALRAGRRGRRRRQDRQRRVRGGLDEQEGEQAQLQPEQEQGEGHHQPA